MKSDQKIKVYYDGLCRLCSAEIDYYRKLDRDHKIDFLDITASGFDPFKEGLDPKKVHRELHCLDEDGTLHIGVQGFILIWSRLKRLKWASRLANYRIIRFFLECGYSIFVRIRPFLPRKKCEDSPYCDLGKG